MRTPLINAHVPLILFHVLALLLLSVLKGIAQEPPFLHGEKLSYRISWSFIPAGRATLEVVRAKEDSPAGSKYHFIMTAHTLPAIALIYPFQERVDSYVTEGIRHSLMYKKLQESGHPRDIVVRFDRELGTAQYSNFGRTEDPISVPPETLDPLSSLYYIRTQQLSNRFPIERPVTDGKKVSLGKAKFIKKEPLTLHGKTYQTIKIEPDLRDVKGVFEKSPGASMYIWLTDDNRKLLVKLKSKVRVGSFIAELIEEESVIPGASASNKQKDEAPAALATQDQDIIGNSNSNP